MEGAGKPLRAGLKPAHRTGGVGVEGTCCAHRRSMAPCPPGRGGWGAHQGVHLGTRPRWQVLSSHALLCRPWAPTSPGPSGLGSLGVWGHRTATPLIPVPSPQQQPRRRGHAAGLHRGRDGSEVDGAPRWRAARDGRVQVGAAPQAPGRNRSPPRSPEPLLRGERLSSTEPPREGGWGGRGCEGTGPSSPHRGHLR